MKFVELYQKEILGFVSGLDRVRFRGTDRALSNNSGINLVLGSLGVLLKDFGNWAQGLTGALREQCAHQAEVLGIPIEYLRSSGVDKEARAREVARENGVRDDGSICMFSVVETCMAPQVHGNRQTKQLELSIRPRKCVFVYHYFDHPQLGFAHVRLQTWLPFTAHICVNGRHWLEKQMMARDIGYHKAGNCFTWIEDVAQAQALLDEQLKSNWPVLLNGLVEKTCPGLPRLFSPLRVEHYWSADETEYATDLMFRSSAQLDALFPKFVQHGMRVSDCPAVLRYFGRRAEGASRARVPAEVKSDCRKRYEGVRIKHWVNGNSVKMYNKERSVLRVETTINNPRNFKAFRSPNDDETKAPSWQKMRKGVSDLHRRCEISKKCNERYLDAMTCAQVEDTLLEIAKRACKKTTRNGRSVRGLNPWNEQDFQLLTFLAKGEWNVNGFQNADLCRCLDPRAVKLSADERKKLSAKATRMISLLRTHGLVRKVAKTHRYKLTPTGSTFATALVLAASVQGKQLMDLAA